MCPQISATFPKKVKLDVRDDAVPCGLYNNDHEKLKSEDPHST